MAWEAGWTGVMDWDNSKQMNDGVLGAGQGEPGRQALSMSLSLLGWIEFYSGSNPDSHFSFVGKRVSCFFPSYHHLGHLSPRLVGLKHEGFRADWCKPVPILGGHMAVFPLSGWLQASRSNIS